jgi:hypothetical protein
MHNYGIKPKGQLLSFLVSSVLFAKAAIFFKLNSVRAVLFILFTVVISLLALRAG